MGIALFAGATSVRRHPDRLETRLDQSRSQRHKVLLRRREWLFDLFVNVVVHLEQAGGEYAPDDLGHLARSACVQRDEPVEARSVFEQELFCV